MQERIYAVTTKADGTGRLVLAQTPAQAMRHVANDLFEVKAANAPTVAKLMSAGVRLESSAKEEETAQDNVTHLPQAA